MNKKIFNEFNELEKKVLYGCFRNLPCNGCKNCLKSKEELFKILEDNQKYLNELYSNSFNGKMIGLKDKNGVDIKCGDKVRLKCLRLSSSYSSWYKETNKNHGLYDIEAIIKYNIITCRFELEYNYEDIKKIEKPIGKEKQNQHVHTMHHFNDRKNLILKNIEVI